MIELMKCNYPLWSPVCAFHYNGICTRDHNYECPAIMQKSMTNLSDGEMAQIAEERKDYVRIVRCKDCKWNGGDCTICTNPNLALGGDYTSCLYIEPEWYCADGKRKENKNDR